MSDIYDFHSHILPGIDDGSRNIEMSERMLDMETEQGVDHILFTPHFYAQQQSSTQFIQNRQQALSQIDALADSRNIDITYRAAAETYYFKGISEAGILDDLCMHTPEKEVLFLEMPFTQWRSSMYHEVEAIIRKREITVVLVHIERFFEFQKDKDIWDSIFELPVIPQHNAGLFLHSGFSLFGKENHLTKITMTGSWPIILGTDAHNTDTRQPNMGPGREKIEKKYGHDILSDIDQRSRRLWDTGQI